jgi:hypothetical protein
MRQPLSQDVPGELALQYPLLYSETRTQSDRCAAALLVRRGVGWGGGVGQTCLG